MRPVVLPAAGKCAFPETGRSSPNADREAFRASVDTSASDTLVCVPGSLQPISGVPDKTGLDPFCTVYAFVE